MMTRRPPTEGERILRALLQRGDIGLISASPLRRQDTTSTVFVAALPPDLATAIIQWAPDQDIDFDRTESREMAVFCPSSPSEAGLCRQKPAGTPLS